MLSSTIARNLERKETQALDFNLFYFIRGSCGKGKYWSMDNTKRNKNGCLTEKMKRSPDEKHIKEHTKNELRCFDTHKGFCQSMSVEMWQLILCALLDVF